MTSDPHKNDADPHPEGRSRVQAPFQTLGWTGHSVTGRKINREVHM